MQESFSYTKKGYLIENKNDNTDFEENPSVVIINSKAFK